MNKLSISLILLMILISGCKSVDYSAGEQTIVKKVADITLTLTPLPQSELIRRYGKSENPLINYPGKFPRRTFLVFDTEIETETTTIEISRNTMDVVRGTETTRGANSYSLIQAWTHYYKSDSEELHMKNTIKKLFKDDEITVTPEAPFRGLLVYLIPVSEETEALMHIPARVPGGDEGIIEIPFTLMKLVDGEKEVPSENTGIFTQ